MKQTQTVRNTKDKTIGVVVTSALYLRIKEAADREDRSVSQFAARILDRAVTKKERQ